MAHKLLDGGHGLTIYDVNEVAMQPLPERQAKGAAKEDLTAIVKYVERDARFEIPKTR
jgi:hypothetical protein